MRERWDEALNKLDEKYISEAAQAHAKHVKEQAEKEQYTADSERPTAIAPIASVKRSRGRIIGVCCAAAAVALVAIGGGVMLSRSNDDILAGHPTAEVTAEATAEFVETAEIPDTPESDDYIIEFAQSYKEGSISFTRPVKAPWLGLNGVVGSLTEMGKAGAFSYVSEIADFDIKPLHNTLQDYGYVLDLSEGGSYYNALAATDSRNRQITFVYVKGDKEIIINFGESKDNFNYCSMEGGYRLTVEELMDSHMSGSWGEDIYFGIGGMVQDDVNYYAVEAEYNGWYNELYNNIFCGISAKGCSTEEIISVVSSVMCGESELTPVEFQPLDIGSYEKISTFAYNMEYPLQEDMIAELSAIVEDFEESNIVYSYRNMDTVPAKLRLYRREGDMLWDTVQLHFSGDEKTYYSIQRSGTQAYYEITEDCGNRLRDWFSLYAPDFMDGVIYDTVGENEYVLIKDEIGTAHTFTGDKNHELGDAVRVWYTNNNSDEIKLNVITITDRHNFSEDNNTIIPEGEEFSGYAPKVFSDVFLGNWIALHEKDEHILKLDYKELMCDHFTCGEVSDGYYLFYYCGGAPTCWFAFKDQPDSLFALNDVHAGNITTLKRNECSYTEYYRTDGKQTSLEGELGTMGIQELCYRMGGNFSEVFWELLYDTPITDEDGTAWYFTEAPNGYHVRPVLKHYAPGTVSYYAEIYMQYVSDYSVPYSESRWYSHTITSADNGETWSLMATARCDQNGVVFPSDGDNREYVLANLRGTVPLNACFSYVKNGSRMFYPTLSVNDENTGILLAQSDIINPCINTRGDTLMFGDVLMKPLNIEGGYAFAVLVPYPTKGETIYAPSFYGFDIINNEIIYIGGSEFFKDVYGSEIEIDSENNIISYTTSEGAVKSYRLDMVNFAAHEIASTESESGNVQVDFSKGEELANVYVLFNSFFGEWCCGDEVMNLSLYSDMFSYSDRCYFYEDNTGSFMLAEGRAWYIPSDDTHTMYYFEDIESGSYSLDDADKMYELTAGMQGFYGGNGEMGWFGVLEMLNETRHTDVEALFNLEITDNNGNVWVRTSDTSIDWGGAYSAYIGREQVHFIKMQSKEDADKFRYVGLRLLHCSDTAEGLQYYSDGLSYVMDMSVADISALPTDYSAEVKESSDSKEYGYFIVETHFYPMENGSYYAVRMMGNNQQQWLADGELFYNNGSGYKHVSRVDNCEFAVSGDYLFHLFTMYYGEDENMIDPKDSTLNLWRYHDGTPLADIFVDDCAFIRMSDIQVIEGNPDWLLIGFFDDVEGADVKYFCELSNPENMTHEDLKRAVSFTKNADGTTTVHFEDGTEATLMIYV